MPVVLVTVRVVIRTNVFIMVLFSGMGPCYTLEVAIIQSSIQDQAPRL